MFDRLDAIEKTYDDLTAELGSPELMAPASAPSATAIPTPSSSSSE